MKSVCAILYMYAWAVFNHWWARLWEISNQLCFISNDVVLISITIEKIIYNSTHLSLCENNLFLLVSKYYQKWLFIICRRVWSSK